LTAPASVSVAPGYRGWGIAFAVIGVLAFSLRPILIKLAYGAHPVSPNTLLFLRMMMSLPFFLAIAWWLRGTGKALSAREWAGIAVLGFLGYLFLYPTLVLVLSFVFLGRRPSARQLGALALTYIGIALVLSDQIGATPEGKLFLLGVLLVFASALCYAAYLVAGSELVQRVGSMRFTAYSMAVATVPAVLQFVLLEDRTSLELPREVWLYAALIGTVCTVLPVFLQAEALKRIGATEFALVGAVSPVSVAVMSAAGLGEPFGVRQTAGAALVIAGVLLVSLKRS
jgi:drug/metabolite transporter (DMT)-like permease